MIRTRICAVQAAALCSTWKFLRGSQLFKRQKLYLVQRAVHADRHPPPADLVDETGDARARQVGRARRDALADVPHCPEVERRVGALGEGNRSGCRLRKGHDSGLLMTFQYIH